MASPRQIVHTPNTLRAPRLFVPAELAPGTSVPVDSNQAQYLGKVMRLTPGDAVRLFNGVDGEWLARVEILSARNGRVRVSELVRPQSRTSRSVHLCIAPIRRSRLELVVEKAVELGVSTFQPVITKRTMALWPDPGRLQRIAIEAAEQAERLDLMSLLEPLGINEVIERRVDSDVPMIAAIERRGQPLARLAEMRGSIAVMIGPEGGFDADEVLMLENCANITSVSLGSRILRTETAAIVAVSWCQLVSPEWFEGAKT